MWKQYQTRESSRYPCGLSFALPETLHFLFFCMYKRDTWQFTPKRSKAACIEEAKHSDK
jgi:hypothetical protein